jgi:hypothetical protein
VNSGNKRSPEAELRFWLSKDKVVNRRGVDPDLPLKLGTFPKAFIAPLKAGAGVRYSFDVAEGEDLRLMPAPGQTGGGHNVLAQFIYEDRLIDHSAVPKEVVSGPVNFILVEAPRVLATTEAGKTAKLTVRLEKAPTSNVTIVVTSSDSTEGQIQEPPVSTDPNDPAQTRKLVFTPSDFAIPQRVVVKGVDDTGIDGLVKYSVVFQKAASTDPAYKDVTAPAVPAANADND